MNETSNFKEGKWQYHDYRNSNINNFHKTIEWLTKQGIWVIRMGSDQYKADGIEITEMTENKILNITKEFYIQNTQKSSNKIKPNKTEKAETYSFYYPSSRHCDCYAGDSVAEVVA